MAENYKIELGVKLDTSDIQKQINTASDNIKPIELKIDAETKALTNTIKEALNSLSKGAKNTLTLDTSKLEASLNDVTSTIREIKTAIGSLDSGSGMKSLVGSINSISTALDKASNKFDELLVDLKSLSSKDFSINFGINLGGSNSVARQGVYGNKVRSETLPQLKQQVNDLVKYYNDTYKETLNEFEALQKMVSGTKLNNGDFFEDFLFGKNSVASRMGNGSLSSQMQAYQAYIDMFKQAASLKGVDLSSVTSSFSKSADELIKDAQDIQTGAKQAEDGFEKLKSVFNGGIDGESLSKQLDSIVVDLDEIKTALQGLSQKNAIDGITQSFQEMSVVLKDITDNLTIFRNAFGNVGSGINNSISNATQGLKNNANVLDTFKESLQNIGMGSKEIDSVADRIKNLGVQIETINQSKPEKGVLSVDISGIDKFGNAVKITEQYSVATGKLVNKIEKVSTVQQKAGVSTNNFAKQQKKAVADLTNNINELHRKANDQNASRPIKDSSHLDSLAKKYDEITNAIQRMESVSSDTFVDEQNNVKKLISEYKSLVSEYRNAENVSIKMKGTDISSGLEIAKNNLEKFKAKAKDFSQLTQTIQELDKAIEGVGDKSSLDSFTDQLRVANAELDKIKAETSVTSKANKLLGDAFNIKSSSGYSKVVSDLENLSATSKEAKDRLDILKTSYKSLESAQQSYSNVLQDSTSNTQQKIEAANRLIEAYKQYKNVLEGSNALVKEEANTEIFANKKAAALDKITDYTNRNTIAAKKYNDEIKEARQLFVNATTDIDFKKAQSHWTTLTKKIKAAGDEGQSFGEKFKKAFASISQYLSAAQLFNYAEQALRSMFEQVKLIDSAMTELKKVTNETDEAYNKFLTNAASRAREIGTTIDGLVSSTADFARLGYGFEDAQGLAEVANIYAVVGDEIEGVEGATKSLISTMAAFKNEQIASGMSNTDFAMSIIDKFNEIGNNFAISSGGIGEALERSASSLMAANNTIDESIALITAANTVVQDPEQVGKWLADYKSGYIG